ncbi:MAG: leucine-rich repeat domain-containing protein, partial [Ruminococcus sp.]|nr:leucine-rich repeat domain-containing protein [Ruminococcus sp.]
YGTGTFARKAITKVVIPDSIVEIGQNSFHNCNVLTTVEIGENSELTAIGNNAFSGNSALKSLYIPKGVTTIGDGAFNNCASIESFTVAGENTAYRSENGHLIESATNTLIRGGAYGAVPESVTAIAQAAFRKANKIIGLNIPKSVTAIGNYFIADSTVAKITSVPKVAEPEPIPQETANIPVSSPELEVPKQTIAGTGIALDSSLAQFNITPPPAEEPVQPKKDDFLSQFAVQKPQPEEVKPAPAVNKLQDDFLAQFAIDVPSQEKQEENFTPEESIDFSAINPPISAYEEPEELPPESEERPVGLIDEDDIMKMFAFGNVQASSSQSPAVDNSNYNYVTPVSEEPEYIPEPVEEVSAQEDFTGNTDLDYVANRLFGIEENSQSEPEPEESQEMSDIELPSMDYISQEIEPVPEYSAPAFDDIELPPLDDVSPAYEEQSAPEYSAPAFDDIELPPLELVTPTK